MSKYQIRDAEGEVLAEDSFDTFDDANVWATQQEVEPGWTMFQQMGGEWVAARHDPLPD
ncbi:hypothetical protein [Aeromicrobium chenweiae]|uniref:hypothetical protein n=1 Tax=Aeromicrobium chenweiae TaxID=2079793 RepID=UPI00131EEBA2|nr:hypothetical protein [Aeromicrobium chenweiae]